MRSYAPTTQDMEVQSYAARKLRAKHRAEQRKAEEDEWKRKWGNKSKNHSKPRTCPEYFPPPGRATDEHAIKQRRYELAHLEQKVVPVKELSDKGLERAAQVALAFPAKLQQWLDTWPQPNTQGEQEDVDTAADLMASIVMERELADAARADAEERAGGRKRNKKNDSEGPNLEDTINYGLAPHLKRFQQSVLQGVGALARGLPLADVEHHAGLTMLRLRLLAKSDPDGLQKLYDLALQQRDVALKQIYEDELRRRVIEGEVTPVFGRVDKDQDGKIGEQVKRDNKLLELALERADPEGAAAVSAAKKAAETNAAAKSGIAVNNAVIYNVSLPEWFEEASGLGKAAKQVARTDAQQTPPGMLTAPSDMKDMPEGN